MAALSQAVSVCQCASQAGGDQPLTVQIEGRGPRSRAVAASSLRLSGSTGKSVTVSVRVTVTDRHPAVLTVTVGLGD